MKIRNVCIINHYDNKIKFKFSKNSIDARVTLLYNKNTNKDTVIKQRRRIQMSRKERKNMMEFIEMMRGIDKKEMLYMTDADIEHIYERTYFQQEIAE